MTTMQPRVAPNRRRRSTTIIAQEDQKKASRSAEASQDADFEEQLEKILPSPSDGSDADTQQAPGPRAAWKAGGETAVQKIAVDHSHKLRAAVRMSMVAENSFGGTRVKKTGVKPTTSVFEAMEQQRQKGRCSRCWLYAFNPTARFKVSWDAGMLLLVIYSSFAVPYKTAFELETILRDDPTDLGMTYREWLVDAMFYLDMILNFWTGYDTGYMIDTRKGKIAWHYLTSRFPVDLLATVEWDLVIRFSVCGTDGCIGDQRSVNDAASLTRMLKVLRLARAGPLLSNLTSRMTVHSVYIDAGAFFLYVIVIAHVLACFFYMIPILFTCDDPHEQVEGTWNMNHTCMPTSWRTNYGLNTENNEALMPTDSQYLSALYWSLTTMTTIGYGDRGPGNDPEIKFTLLAEILGLCFFVLLLQEITSVYEESRRQVTEVNQKKDEIVQFMKRSVPSSNSMERKAKRRLIDKVVGFLRFKATSSSRREFNVDESPNFGELSDALQEEIKVAVFRPVLKEVRMFGQCSEDREDEDKVADMFRTVDADHSGYISDSEVSQLIFEHFQVSLSDEELAAAIEKMDSAGGASTDKEAQIELIEFQHWWYLQKHGRPKIGPCPNEMLEYFASRVRSECASPCDRIVRKGEFGNRLFIVTGGSVEICDHALEPGPEQHQSQDFVDVPSSFGRILRRIDSQSQDKVFGKDMVFGLVGVLNEPGMPAEREFREIKRRMYQVAVYAGCRDTDYTEVLYFTNGDVISGLKRRYHYDSWDVGEFGEPLRYWQEVARNMYCKMYWYDKDDAYEWGKHKQGTAEKQGEELAAVDVETAPKKARGKGPGARGRGAGRVMKAAATSVLVGTRAVSKDGDGKSDFQRVESRQDRIVEEQVVIERKVSLLDRKVDELAQQQNAMIEKLDAIANFLSPDLNQQKNEAVEPAGNDKKKRPKTTS
jgi:hypothetical protein